MEGIVPKIVASLLHYGSDSNIKGQNGETALIEASANGHFEIVEILLNENALIDIADGAVWSKTPDIHFLRQKRVRFVH
jgi:serine/threonine-protein phosphatase 6 regulatory ankyrin repeat subunit B